MVSIRVSIPKCGTGDFKSFYAVENFKWQNVMYADATCHRTSWMIICTSYNMIEISQNFLNRVKNTNLNK